MVSVSHENAGTKPYVKCYAAVAHGTSSHAAPIREYAVRGAEYKEVGRINRSFIVIT